MAIETCRFFESENWNLLVKHRQEYMYGAYGIYQFLSIVKNGHPDPLRPQILFFHILYRIPTGSVGIYETHCDQLEGPHPSLTHTPDHKAESRITSCPTPAPHPTPGKKSWKRIEKIGKWGLWEV